jgi:hypothetical protein
MRAVVFTFVCVLVCSCGGGDGEEAYDNFQDCYVDHNQNESLPPMDAIAVCCIEHPIDGKKGVVCGATSADCVTYLTANLTGPTSAEIMSGCDEYVSMKDE